MFDVDVTVATVSEDDHGCEESESADDHQDDADRIHVETVRVDVDREREHGSNGDEKDARTYAHGSSFRVRRLFFPGSSKHKPRQV
jgi:hypothetical protein